MARGRPRSPSPSFDSYSSDYYRSFLSRMDATGSDLAEAQADRSEILKAEAQRGLNRKAHAFVQALWTAVRNDKLTQQDAVATVDCVTVYALWCGLTAQRDMFRPREDQPGAAETVTPLATNGNGSAKAKKDEPSSDGAFKAAQRHLGTEHGDDLPPAA